MLRNDSSEHVGALLGVTSAHGNALRRRSALLIGLLGLIVSACSSSTAKKQLSDGCVLNSDCSTSLVCTFGRCHTACVTSQDCPSGATCVKSSSQSSVCLLPAEASCINDSRCPLPLVCGVDQNCRGSCKSTSDCPTGQKCTNSKTCAEPSQVDANNDLIIRNDAGASGAGGASSNGGSNNAGGTSAGGSTNRGGATNVGGAPPGGSASLGGGSNLGGSNAGGSSAGGTKAGGGTSGAGGTGVGGSGTGGQTGTPCPSAQTQFNVAQGDSNPNFISGVGLRASKSLLIFSSYRGPDPSGAADAGAVNLVYVQEFDPVTAASRGPAKPLFAVNPSDTSNVTVYAASVASTGQIALLYWSAGSGLKAAFLNTSSDADAGAMGLQVQQTVLLEAASLNNQPQTFWSATSGCFVFSWNYSGAGTVKVRKFLADGRSAGGGTDELPTDNSNDYTSGYRSGAVAASGKLFGVAYDNYSLNVPYFTVLDQLGNEVGVPIELATGGSNWITAAGTSAGFVTFYSQGGVAEMFIPVGADGSVAAAQTVDAGALSGFHFGGTKVAVYGRALNDDVGGIGGVGLALLYQDGVAFAYVNTDGLTHVGPASVLAHTYGSGDYVNISNFGGSFGVSLYSAADHSTQMAASGCSP